MPKFTPKPQTVLAVQWRGDNWPEIEAFAGTGLMNNSGHITIQTPEGLKRADSGDWLVYKNGFFYVRNADKFEQEYDIDDVEEFIVTVRSDSFRSSCKSREEMAAAMQILLAALGVSARVKAGKKDGDI